MTADTTWLKTAQSEDLIGPSPLLKWKSSATLVSGSSIDFVIQVPLNVKLAFKF